MAVKKVTKVTLPVQLASPAGTQTTGNITFTQEHNGAGSTVEAKLNWIDGKDNTFTVNLDELGEALLMLRGAGLVGSLFGGQWAKPLGRGNGSNIEENT